MAAIMVVLNRLKPSRRWIKWPWFNILCRAIINLNYADILTKKQVNAIANMKVSVILLTLKKNCVKDWIWISNKWTLWWTQWCNSICKCSLCNSNKLLPNTASYKPYWCTNSQLLSINWCPKLSKSLTSPSTPNTSRVLKLWIDQVTLSAALKLSIKSWETEKLKRIRNSLKKSTEYKRKIPI